MKSAIDEFLEHLKTLGRAEGTLSRKRAEMLSLVKWMDQNEIGLKALTRNDLISYLSHLKTVRGIANVTISNTAAGFRMFFRHLAYDGKIPKDIGFELPSPKRKMTVPYDVMTYEEIKRLLEKSEPKNAIAFRNRVILEVMYSSALRRSEVMKLDIQHINLNERKIYVRLGKGNKDRVVPVGESALAWVKRYLDEIREKLNPKPEQNALFLTKEGKRIGSYSIAYLVEIARKRANITRKVSAHSLRHSSATHLMWEGAGIREISEFLGHTSLKTTARYCHIKTLKR